MTDDVYLNRGRITLHETKNGERRVVTLAGKLGTPLLFPRKVKSHEPIDLRTLWMSALKQAEIEDFRFHDPRHSAASYLAMNGASLAEIAEVLGHRTLAMVRRYSHLSEAHTANVVARMNRQVFG